MPWSTTRPPDAKYRTREHRELRAHYVRRIKAGEQLDCTARVCLLDRVPITNPNGNAPDGLHLGHNDDGVTYAGPQHNVCNVHDAAVRGNERSKGTAQQKAPPKRWLLRDYHACPACGAAVMWASQRCCSRACAMKLRRRSATQAKAAPPPVIHTCTLCGATFTGRKRKYCGSECQVEANARQNRDRYRRLVGLVVNPAMPTTPRTRPEF